MPSASAENPATAALSRARSASRAAPADPTFENMALIESSTRRLSSSSFSSSARRFTSSFARASAARPSASASARSRAISLSRPAWYCAVARRSASTAAAARTRSAS